MSGLLKANLQLGDSATATQNFTLSVPATPDGTVKLARGNAGATTQDILTVDANGKPRFNQLAQSLSTNGYKVLEGGLIVQWGYVTLATGAANTWASINANYPIAFPTAVLGIVGNSNNGAALSNQVVVGNVQESSLTQCTVSVLSSLSAVSGIRVSFIAIGY